MLIIKYSLYSQNTDIRGIVIKCFPSQQVKHGTELSTTRDVVIVNEE